MTDGKLFEYDEETDTVKINGILYPADFFRNFSDPDNFGKAFTIQGREDGEGIDFITAPLTLEEYQSIFSYADDLTSAIINKFPGENGAHEIFYLLGEDVTVKFSKLLDALYRAMVHFLEDHGQTRRTHPRAILDSMFKSWRNT